MAPAPLRPPRRTALLAAMLLTLAPVVASAQEASVESRLREALRRSTVELRALQDNQAAIQAALDQAKQQNADLTRQVEILSASAAAKPAKAEPDPQVAALREAVPALQEQNRGLRADVLRLQSAYEQAAQVARARDAEGKRLDQRLRDTDARFGLCRQENAKLIGVANDILHLYRTPEFRATVIGSWEPLLGLKQVELQNTVQDYEDKILDHRYINQAAPTPAPEPAPASAPATATANRHR